MSNSAGKSDTIMPTTKQPSQNDPHRNDIIHTAFPDPSDPSSLSKPTPFEMAPRGEYPEPIHSSFNAWQIDSARRMHQLTVRSRIPTRFQKNGDVTDPRHTVEPAKFPSMPSKTPENACHHTDGVEVPAKDFKGSCRNPRCEHCGAVIIPAPSAIFPLKDTPSISINDWQVFTARNPILDASEIENFESILGLPVPEMIFGNNKVEIRNESKGFHLCFNSLDALKTVSNDPKDIPKVSYANEWFKSRAEKHHNDDDVMMEVFKPFDWTYTTKYKGTELVIPESGFIRDDSMEIPHQKLMKRSPILFFDNMTLFEDELGDNGLSTLNIKVRVMHDCMLILQRLFVRIDNVLVRIHDTRLYVDFEQNLVVREFKRQQEDYDKLLNQARGSSDPRKMLRDLQWCSLRIPVVDVEREYLPLNRHDDDN